MQISNSYQSAVYAPSYSVGAAGQDASPAQSAGQASSQPANSSPSTLSPTLGSTQFDTQLLTALLGVQQGDAAGSSLDLKPLELLGYNPSAGPISNIATSDGVLDPSEIQGQSATSLADDLVSAFGSNGGVSESQINQAYLTGATAPSQVVDGVKKVIDSDWSLLSGGSDTISAADLSSDIQKYLLDGAA
jgi:hypothetical protein